MLIMLLTIIGASLSKPQTSEKDGTSVVFTQSAWKYRLMVRVSYIHKSVCLKVRLKTRYLQILCDVCLSHKQLPNYFIDTPYKAGIYIHHTINTIDYVTGI